ncbi:alpha/beta hydrolase fold domain-containing protein [Streptomyces sp. NPDC046939]|uniref:alpha/beta hydrolase fold domain-containing protein n=1 Tax=Streptomyces sp. NPDC046939 TaxID=3155376 RepID=UPI0033C144EB
MPRFSHRSPCAAGDPASRSRCPVLSRAYLAWFWGADPLVSPARSKELSGLAPVVIATAENDPLRDQGDHYARRLADAAVPVQHLPVEGAVHGFLSFTGSVATLLSQDVLTWPVRQRRPPDLVAAAIRGFTRTTAPASTPCSYRSGMRGIPPPCWGVVSGRGPGPGVKLEVSAGNGRNP